MEEPALNPLAAGLNKTLGPVADLFAPAGRRMYFPYGGILGQGAEAKTCDINATIGMAFEEDGSPLTLDCFEKLTPLPSTAFLYAGSFGLPKLRQIWRDMEVKKNPALADKNFSNPVVTNALTHGLRVAAELFAGPGDTLILPDLYWDNYALVFQEACGASIDTFTTFTADRKFNAAGLAAELAKPGTKKIVLLNFPNNPTGYTATEADAQAIVAALKAAADAGKKLVVILDDAYFGLVYEAGVHNTSLFSELCDASPNLLAVKLDGTTKEDYVWGLRVGFITFAFKGATPEQLKALEAKAAGNVRSSISNASSIGQHMAIAAYSDPAYAAQKQEKFEILKRRYQMIREILRAHVEYQDAFEAMPFNSGYFMCVRPKGIDAESVRKQLIAKYSTGTIVLSGLIRLAYSTIPCHKLERLFANVYAAVNDLRA